MQRNYTVRRSQEKFTMFLEQRFTIVNILKFFAPFIFFGLVGLLILPLINYSLYNNRIYNIEDEKITNVRTMTLIIRTSDIENENPSIKTLIKNINSYYASNYIDKLIIFIYRDKPGDTIDFQELESEFEIVQKENLIMHGEISNFNEVCASLYNYKIYDTLLLSYKEYFHKIGFECSSTNVNIYILKSGLNSDYDQVPDLRKIFEVFYG